MKQARQRKIMEIVGDTVFGTQEDLVAALTREGFKATQATVSRDIKELGLLKVPAGERNYRYVVNGDAQGGMRQRLDRLFKDAVTTLDASENLIVIKTLPGAAQSVAAGVDQLQWQEIIGTVAGDDTILVVIKPKDAAGTVLQQFLSFLG